MLRLVLALGVVGLLGCGLGPIEDESGGADNLPTQAAGPYNKIVVDFDTPADEPYLVKDISANLVEPAGLPRSDGGYRLWFGRIPIQQVEGEIWAAELPALTELPDVGPVVAITADAAWEQGLVTEPAVFENEDGTLVMFYRGGIDMPAIGRADSADGVSWTKHPGNPLVTGAMSPAIAMLDGEWLLVATSVDEQALLFYRSDNGIDFSAPMIVIEPRPTKPEAFDTLAVRSPFLVAQTAETGTQHFGLFFEGDRAGELGPISSIGYAGSFDGMNFTRFSGADPIINRGLPAEHAPSVIVDGPGAVMFFTEQRQSRQRIAVALHPG